MSARWKSTKSFEQVCRINRRERAAIFKGNPSIQNCDGRRRSPDPTVKVGKRIEKTESFSRLMRPVTSGRTLIKVVCVISSKARSEVEKSKVKICSQEGAKACGEMGSAPVVVDMNIIRTVDSIIYSPDR